jgi:hypothetical protein
MGAIMAMGKKILPGMKKKMMRLLPLSLKDRKI